MEAEEAACNENPHRRDLSKECRILPLKSVYGSTVMSNILAGGLIKKLSKISSQAHSTDIRSVVRRIVVDTSSDIQDVQFCTCEYASKKFKAARDILPELHQGLDRLKKQLEEEKGAAEAETAEVAMNALAPGSKGPLGPEGFFCFNTLLLKFYP